MKLKILLLFLLIIISSSCSKKYNYDISGFVHISYQNQALGDVNIQLINHKKLVVGETKTNYSGIFKLKGTVNNIPLKNLSKWYISFKRKEYKPIKMPLVWEKKNNSFTYIKKLNFNMECLDNGDCMASCCKKGQSCTHPINEDGGTAMCL